jgi:hypothetical protein
VLETAKRIIPALTRDYLDAAAFDLAVGGPSEPALPAAVDGSAAGGGTEVATPQGTPSAISKKAAWAAAPKWLTGLRSQVKAMLDGPSLNDHSRGESKNVYKMTPLHKLGEVVTMAPFSTVLMQWQLDFASGSKLADELSKSATTHYEQFVTARGAGKSPRVLNNDFFDYQVSRSVSAARFGRVLEILITIPLSSYSDIHHLIPLSPSPSPNRGKVDAGGLFKTLKAFRKVEARFRSAAAEFLIRYGMDPKVARKRAATRRVDSWASVHSAASLHTAHSHFASTVSGVFYAR